MERFHSYYLKDCPFIDEQGGQWSCWEWQKAKDKDGYGRFRAGRKFVRAHKFSFELANGPLPGGTEIDHLCRNRPCVRPDHLEAVSHKTNQQRMTKCPNGHYYDSEFGEMRLCSTCGAVTPKRKGS